MTDSQGLSGSATQIVQVAAESNNSSLSAHIKGPGSAQVGQEVFFHPKASGDDLQYAWDFGDGATRDGEDVSHTYSNTGNYWVTLTVTDKHGQSQSVTHKIKID